MDDQCGGKGGGFHATFMRFFPLVTAAALDPEMKCIKDR